MAEELNIVAGSQKKEMYKSLLPQMESLIADEPNMVAKMANIAAALKQTFNFFWVGFYIVESETLVLGPFQGSVACNRIMLGKGVCGKAWSEKKAVIVPNVDEFPGHIACSSASKSEIVLPGIDATGTVQFVLDVDSDQLNDFDNTDKKYLLKTVRILLK